MIDLLNININWFFFRILKRKQGHPRKPCYFTCDFMQCFQEIRFKLICVPWEGGSSISDVLPGGFERLFPWCE